MKDRIFEFLRNSNKTSSQFADEIGVQPSSVSHIISGRNKPSLDFVIKMLQKYPELSTDWLIFGRGSMFIDNNSSTHDDELSDNQLVDLFETPAKSNLTEDLSHGPDIENDSSIEVKSAFKSSENRISKVILLYEDGSFKEYGH